MWRIDRQNSQTGSDFSAYLRGAEVGTLRTVRRERELESRDREA